MRSRWSAAARRRSRTCTTSSRTSRRPWTRAGCARVLGETWLDFPVPDHKDLAESHHGDARVPREVEGTPARRSRPSPRTRRTRTRRSRSSRRDDLALEFKAPLLIHLSETKDEQKQIAEKYGTTPAKWLESIGFLGPNVLAAHGVWLRRGRPAAPRRAARRPRAQPRVEHEARLGHRARRRPRGRRASPSASGRTASRARTTTSTCGRRWTSPGSSRRSRRWIRRRCPAKDLLRMATIEGARAMKLDDRIGSLEAGQARGPRRGGPRPGAHAARLGPLLDARLRRQGERRLAHDGRGARPLGRADACGRVDEAKTSSGTPRSGGRRSRRRSAAPAVAK